VMKLHGGDITAHSAANDLTRFEIHLPNVYPLAILPDLSSVSNRRVRVISPTKSGGGLFSGVLDEAGMLDVTVLPPEPKALQNLAGEEPHLLILELAEDSEAARTLAEWLVQLPIRCPFLIYGPSGAILAFQGVWENASHVLNPPFNPLLLLQRVEELLSNNKDLEKSAAG